MAQPNQNYPNGPVFGQQSYYAQPNYPQQPPTYVQAQGQQPMYGQPVYAVASPQPYPQQPQPQYYYPQQPASAQPAFVQPTYAQPAQYAQQPHVYGQAHVSQSQPFLQPQAPISTHHIDLEYAVNPAQSNAVVNANAGPRGGAFDYEGRNEQDDAFRYRKAQYNDVWAAVLFVLQFAAIVFIAAKFGPAMLKGASASSSSSSTTTTTNDDPKFNGMQMIQVLIGASAISLGLSFFYVYLLKSYTRTAIKLSFWVGFALLALSCIFAFVSGSLFLAVALLICIVLNLLYWKTAKRFIPFCEVLIETSIKVMEENSGPLIVAFVTAALNVGWCLLWIFAFVSVYYHLAPASSTSSATQSPQAGYGFLMFFLFVSFYWTTQVLRYVSHLTSCGVVASWFLLPQQQQRTWPALKRSLTTSFGSICFGALLIAIIRSTRAMLRYARENSRDIALCIVDCLLGIFEGLVRFFNFWAYTNIAIYGTSYWTAAKETYELMQSEFISMLVNADLSGMVLQFGCLVIGAVVGLGSALVARSLHFQGYYFIGIVAFLLAYTFASIFFSVIESAVATVFVVWAEDPHSVARNRPQEMTDLVHAAKAISNDYRLSYLG